MRCSRLPNYLRTHRKRAHLSQGEVAFLLGCHSGACICRHERFQQAPSLETLLAYELLFRTPIRTLFNGVHHEVSDDVRRRTNALARKLARDRRGCVTERKLATLKAVLEEASAAQT